MGFKDVNSGAAAAVYLCLYSIYSAFAAFVVYRKGIKTPYTFLLAFGLIRVGAQISGIGVSITGIGGDSDAGISWLIAYLILGNESYFCLLLVSLLFLCRAEVRQLGYSQFRPTDRQLDEKSGGNPFKRRIVKLTSPASIYHWVLIPANILIIVGGSKMAGVAPDEASQYKDLLNQCKILRGVGQALFLLQNVFVGFVGFYLYFKRGVKSYVVVGVLCGWAPLLVRGIYGLLSVFISEINYFSLDNYISTGGGTGGMAPRFLVCEYVLQTTMEFLGASFILSTYCIKNDEKYKLGRSSASGSDTVDEEHKLENVGALFNK